VAILTAANLTNILNAAGGHDRLEVAQWLRQQGAEWPLVLRTNYHTGGPVSWHGATFDWARAEGCTSPGFKRTCAVAALY
jgi:hypothetical protein